MVRHFLDLILKVGNPLISWTCIARLNSIIVGMYREHANKRMHSYACESYFKKTGKQSTPQFKKLAIYDFHFFLKARIL